jgi:predicted outer membrane repeat protein
MSQAMATARAQGRMIELLPLDVIDERHLVRDRLEQNEDEMTALTDSLRLPVQTQLVRLPSGQWIPRVTKIGSRSSNVDDPKGFWTVQLNEGAAIGPRHGFEDIVLRAGDYATISYFEDEDLDGLSVQLEESFATRPDCDDCDEDGLDDGDEAVRGWIAGDDTTVDDWPVERARIEDAEETLRTSGLQQADYDAAQAVLDGFILHDSRRGYPRWVRSNPTLVDSDFDGLKDADERAAHTDPTNPDTDGDNLKDGEDPYPLIPARTLRVDASAAAGGDGSTWNAAIARLQDALAEASNSNADSDPTNDVSEIWVAAGFYSPSIGGSFVLVDKVAVYGGFDGTERARGARNADPFTNQTVIGTGSRLVSAVGVGSSTVLDGFAISDGTVGILISNASPVLRNLVFNQNSSTGASAQNSSPSFEDCAFLSNGFLGYQGGAIGMRGGAAVIERCTFEDNSSSQEGGAIHGLENAKLEIRECRFTGNSAGFEDTDSSTAGHGGAIFIASGRLYIDGCVFEGNTAVPLMVESGYKNGGAGAVQVGPEGASFMSGDFRAPYTNDREYPLEASIVNSVFRANSGWGGAVYAPRDWQRANYTVFPQPKLSMVNCTLAGNDVFFAGGVTVGPELDLGFGNSTLWDVTMTNTIVYGNKSRSAAENFSASIQFLTGYPAANRNVDTALSFIGGAKLNNCLIGLRTEHYVRVVNGQYVFARRSDMRFSPTSLFGVDPLFVSPTNPRLTSNSPAIDAGTNFVDVDVSTAGAQPLPDVDLDQAPRRADGSGNGQARVDIGAYEFQR